MVSEPKPHNNRVTLLNMSRCAPQLLVASTGSLSVQHSLEI